MVAQFVVDRLMSVQDPPPPFILSSCRSLGASIRCLSIMPHTSRLRVARCASRSAVCGLCPEILDRSALLPPAWRVGRARCRNSFHSSMQIGFVTILNCLSSTHPVRPPCSCNTFYPSTHLPGHVANICAPLFVAAAAFDSIYLHRKRASLRVFATGKSQVAPREFPEARLTDRYHICNILVR